MTPEIVGNTIIGNRAELGDGGGIYIVTGFDGTIIRGNWIEGNFAGDHGGGVYVAGVPSAVVVEISENIILNNQANGRGETGESGGGIWLEETDVWVHHNTIVQNTGNGPTTTYGGALTIHQPGSPIVEQNVIVFTQNGGGIFCHSGATPTIRNNLAWQNLPVDGAGLCETWTQGDGNVVADPLFCNMTAGVFSVGQGSPALTHPAGPLGAYPTPGCQPIVVQPVTWSGLKSRFTGR